MEFMAARSRRTRHSHHHHHHHHQLHLAADPHAPSPPPPPPVDQQPQLITTTTTTNGTQQQSSRRMDLELEVAELKKKLSDEETVHHILERALQPATSAARSLNIPAFIPAKARELLAELVLVEEEIARLEAQIDTMKKDRPMPPTGGNGIVNGGGGGGANGTTTTASRTTPPNDQLMAPEIKSMFFISQAMNGEYLKRHLAAAEGDKVAKSPRETTSTRSSSAAAAMSSPKLNNNNNNNSFGLPPRNSLDNKAPKTSQPTPAPSSSPATKRPDEQPTKLSERIAKCLVCIFIRLLRSSRAAEIEKSAAGNLQGGGGSFRIDAALGINAAAAAAKEKKERGQQDHYGIFGITDSIVRDIGPYKNLVRFTSSSFDLRGFSASPLLTKLREMLEALQQVDLRFQTHQQKLAFWLNIYKTCIMHGILQHGLPSNSEKLLALKNKATINVSGEKFNALVIENFILRQPSSVKEELWKCDVDVDEQRVRGVYGLNSSEPNILFALCCGTRSSPSLRIYKADRVIGDLEKAKLDYLQASLVVTSTPTARRVMIPGLVHSNMHDFAKDTESLLRWVCDQLPTSWPLRKSMVDCLRAQSHLKVDVIPYDYEFQYLLPM